jgi:serine/threonine protein kinase/Tol biopolymer transport system component
LENCFIVDSFEIAGCIMGARFMGLEAGGHLGHYEILSLLGTGGMGEVYRARDTKLSREVALKVLPEAMVHDAQRMARFEREARTLASLNHPNIAAIYGLETSNGVTSLVMELAEGETLEERIARSSKTSKLNISSSGSRRGLQTEECLHIAKQIAEALEYAHERGVVHRDLKPANVKITPEGAVKVLDFGLAKVLSNDDSASMDPSNSPTLSVMATQMGIILGTAAYMAPEQAKGKQVDRRADIWAFGCVLYEMLTGKKPFEGETISDILASVIKSEPDWAQLPEATPPSMQRLVRRCLQKDPKQRLQAIGDARIAIDETLSGADAEAIAYGGLTSEGGRRSRLRRALPWAMSAAIFLLGAFLGYLYFRTRSMPLPAVRSFITTPDNVQFEYGWLSGAPVLSPDGTRLAFPGRDVTGKTALWMRPLDSLNAQPLQGTEGATFPFWAPDGRQLGFFQAGKIKKIDVTSGPPVLICDAADGRGGTWNGNGVIVFAPEDRGGLSRVPAAGGTPTAVVPLQKNVLSDRWPEFLPDGKHFLYLSGDPEAPGTTKLGIRIGELGSTETKFLLQADSDALYAEPGHLLFLRGNTLMAQRFDAGSLKLKGEAFPVAEPIPSPGGNRQGIFNVSQTGLLIHATGQSRSGGALAWVDTTGKQIGKAGPTNAAFPRLSPNGKMLAYMSVGNINDIWLIDLTRDVQTRFTIGPAANQLPVWSPDGSRIAYHSAGKDGSHSLFVKDASGAGAAQFLLKSNSALNPTDWSRDGRYLLYQTQQESNGKASIWVLPLFGDRNPFAYLQTQFNARFPVFSPDGHWVAYRSDESGRDEVYLSTFPAGGGKWQVSQGGGRWARFSRDGRELYYVGLDGEMMEASVTERGPTVEVGTPHQLFQLNGIELSPYFDVTPDGKRFLLVEGDWVVSQQLTLVTNWTAGLRK